MADVSVRPARAEDVPEIARIQIETWRTGYAEVLPAAVIDALDVAAAVEAWRGAVSAPPAGHHVLVALEQDWLVGFAAVVPDAGEDDDPAEFRETTALIAPLLVEPRWGRRGHASRLLAAATDHAIADGRIRMITWIPEADTASREFFVSAGWAPDGLARALDTGAGELREIRLHTTVS
jgi:GNAT superfamily N-acetyltransferase